MEPTLDELNKSYFQGLADQRDKKPISLKIGENAFPTAIAPPDLLKGLPYKNYKDLLDDRKKYEAAARKCCLWLKKAQGGGGTSILRQSFLDKIQKKKAKLGAKGTDLFIKTNGKYISLAEIQILKACKLSEDKVVSEIHFQNLVGTDSQESVKALWSKKSLATVEEIKTFYKCEDILQSALLTIDEKNNFSKKRMAPGGHGFFAYEALLSAVQGKGRPTSKNNLISVIGNGEDLGSTPDPIVLGWAIEEKTPIVMITTEKTEVDHKGGQISLVKEGNFSFVTLIEQAQAKACGQIELFESIGLTKSERGQKAFFNTNVALFNYDVLVPKLKELVKKIGIDEFKKKITPDLIENVKSQKDDDGVTRKYIQLEGAMGSSLLNLDRAWRENFSEPLVHFVNIEREYRTKFFSPVKSAFDFFMLFYSDRFSFDFKTLNLIDQSPGRLPLVSMGHEFYQDVENTLEAFEGARILKLESLHLEGDPILLKGTTLSGKIKIKNKSGKTIDRSGQDLSNKELSL